MSRLKTACRLVKTSRAPRVYLSLQTDAAKRMIEDLADRMAEQFIGCVNGDVYAESEVCERLLLP